MAGTTPSKALIDLLKVTGGLLLNLSQASPHFKKLTESDYQLIFDILSKPETWETMSEQEQITYITRFDRGRILRDKYLTA